MTSQRKPLKKSANIIANDPLDLNWRLYQQLGRLLDDMEAADRDERMTMPQRVSAMIAIGRLQKIFIDLRKGDANAGAGSAVQRYATVFQTAYDPGPGNKNAGTTNIIEFDNGPDDDDRDDED